MRFLNTMVLCIAFVYAALAQGPVCNSNFNVAPKEGMKTTYSPPPNPPAGPTGPSGGGPTGERFVMFLHGLNGNVESWLDVATATEVQDASDPIVGYPSRKAACLRTTYTQNTMFHAANEVQTAFVEYPYAAHGVDVADIPKSFIVAHSQGGLVSRNLDRLYANGTYADQFFGGIVTFGSPHQGANIIDNGPTGFPIMAENACIGITAGPIAEGIENTPFLDFFDQFASFQSIGNTLCDILNDDGSEVDPLDPFDPNADGIDVMSFFMGSAIPATGVEFGTTGTFIPQINNPDQSQVSVIQHKVAFYGIETQPVLWKEIYNLKEKLPNDFDPFDAADDSPLVGKAMQMQALSAAKLAFWQDQTNDLLLEAFDDCNGFQWTFIPCIISIGNYFDAAETCDAWQLTANWWQTANEQYRTIIGELQSPTTVETTVCNCDYYVNGEFDESISTETYTSCLDGGFGLTFHSCDEVTTSAVVYEEHLSDGVVLIESAVGYPGAQTEPDPYNNPNSLYLMQGSNHQQMRNDPNTKVKMFKLLEGNFDPWFKVDAD